jgi:uracil-DNA glycosylase family 4
VSAATYLPARLSLRSLRAAAAGCQACDLYKHATQTVLAKGARVRGSCLSASSRETARTVRAIRVGPAGRILHEAMERAGLSPDDVYVTNVVKHFKFIRPGKRRMHDKPKAIEIRACRPWLDAEIEVVRPDLIVALGATAAQAFLGSGFSIAREPWTGVRDRMVAPAAGHDSSLRHSAGTRFGVTSRRNGEVRLRPARREA